ncbi:HAMP domain-containing histidine kinase [Paenibacillus sp. SYP-B3998]|uniref:histidine kinase n=1 Tax=Paenibacillus sp. SYP-B3998 TaxID=2678564 RepID=A0A6G4A0X9_9BACL|nr:HAMP domain-containing sensor histidine kinase [Paenibacillus sp. SYP-B3998]NEW08123.1 HAMP domain-containing histidine kinase [Paenibacillus sp. SYP-B3998]
MRQIRRRLAIHFTVQFFFLWVFVMVTLIAALLLIIQYLVNQDLKRNFPSGAMDTIITETVLKGGDLTIPSRWISRLTERGYWLQVLDGNGQVIYSANVPAQLKTSYGVSDLLQIQETGHYEVFRVMTKLDTTEGKPFLYMLGSEDHGAERLQAWLSSYVENGLIRSDAVIELESQLTQSKENLQIIDAGGQIVQTVGPSVRQEPYRPLDLISMQSEPGSYPSNMSFYYDQSSGYIWILQVPKEGGAFASQPILHDVILVLVISGLFVLLLTFAFAVWHGYRYGQPLLLFADWFERMGQGHYHEALTEKDRKKVFRKNGTIRLRYRLYKEVIAGFYDMATKLDASEQERGRLEKTREEWMTGISHDLRTPLSTIQGYGHLLESGQFEWTDAELEEMGKMIREKGNFMLDLLQDFSLTFQLKNKAISFPLEDIELNEFVRRVVLRYVNDVTIQHVSFVFEEEETDLIVKANAKWFQRMLYNLITNAVKHNPAGTLIKVKMRKEGDAALIVVEDNGKGMDEETKRNLFERYYRGTNTEEGTDGAGLGMSIANAIVTAHHGTIKVESQIGRGTRVILRFPQAPFRSPDTVH